MSNELTPETRRERYYDAMLGGDDMPADPHTREERYLEAIVEAIEAGSSDEKIQEAVDNYMENNPDAFEEAIVPLIAPAYDDTAAYKVGNLLTYLGKQYYCIADAPAGTLPTNTTYFEEKSVADIIEMIKTGEITVGKANLANNFDSKMVLTDNSGYLYRTTGGSLEVGEQNRVKKIIGASVPIIQYISNLTSSAEVYGITRTASADGKSMTFSGTCTESTNFTIVYSSAFNNGNVWYFDVGNVDLPSGARISFVSTDKKTRTLGKPSTQIFGLYITEGTTINVTVKPIAVNLTRTFGTTVAERLNTLEVAQAGSGVEKVKEILVKDYYPYNVTAFTHTKTSGKVNNGFNQWDEQWEQGYYNLDTGEKVDSTNRIRSKNKIEILPSTTYYFRYSSNISSIGVAFFDANEEWVSRQYLNSNSTFETPSDAHYMVFHMPANSGGTYNNNICINLHWDGERDGEYEPYQEWNYPVEDIELKGILSLDASDNWVADGDEYLPSGVVDENYELLDIGTISDWTYNTTGKWFSSQSIKNAIKKPATINVAGEITLIGYENVSRAKIEQNTSVDKLVAINVQGNLLIRNLAYTDPETFQSAVNGVYLLYKLETTTESSADSYTELQNDSNWGTEKWIDTRDVPMPVFSTCEYITDLKAKVETAPESPDEDGDYIMHRENGLNSYSSLATYLSDNGYAPNVIPTAPAEDGTYTLKVTIADGEATYSWVADT